MRVVPGFRTPRSEAASFRARAWFALGVLGLGAAGLAARAVELPTQISELVNLHAGHLGQPLEAKNEILEPFRSYPTRLSR